MTTVGDWGGFYYRQVALRWGRRWLERVRWRRKGGVMTTTSNPGIFPSISSAVV